jgi:DNA modification methylase
MVKHAGKFVSYLRVSTDKQGLRGLGIAAQRQAVLETNAGMGSLYRSRHELILVFKNGTAPHINNVELGRFGRNRSNVWEYGGQNVLNGTSKSKLSVHPTAKPVALVADAIRDCSHRNGVILDCFGGSGTTLIAAETTGRSARLIELDPRYVDVTIRRWQNVTGRTAVKADKATACPDNGAHRHSFPVSSRSISARAAQRCK